MEGISDIKITGIDEKRRPRLHKEPYINLYFTLSHQAPAAWCADFNRLFGKHKYTPKITESEGRFIEAWVRAPDEIPSLLAELKAGVKQCSEEFIARINAATAAGNAGNKIEDVGEQARLNAIIAGLKFD